MQCPSCNAKWDLDSSKSKVKLKTCPFCGASLEPEEKPDLTTIEGILRSIVLKYSEKIYEYSNAQQFKALLNDLASNFPKERDQLRIAIDKQIPSRLLKKNDSDDEEKSHEAMESSYILVDGIGLQPLIAQKTVALLMAGLGWKIFVDVIQLESRSNSDLQNRYDELLKKHEELVYKYQLNENEQRKTDNTASSRQSPITTNIENHQPAQNDIIFIEGGTFQMGSNDGADDEKPIHSITVSSFYMCDHEVTQKEYTEMVGSNPSYFIDDHKPVERVSWFDAIYFCNLKSQKEGLTPCYTYSDGTYTCNFNANGYRLPTEAEWEYAAQGGNQTFRYTYSGSDSADNVAWYYDNSGEQTHDVATKTPNELGLYDMSGNVWEWCWDWYGSYKQASQTNPTGVSSGSHRVVRGGSWYSGASNCRVAYRFSHTPSNSNIYVGFRVVRSSPK